MKHKTQNLDLLKLVSYIQEQPAGTVITYEAAHHDTAVAMDTEGKALMRQAFKEARRVYKIQKGVGWWLDCAQNASDIVDGKTRQVYNGFVRVKTTIEILRPLYYHMLPEEERKLIDLRASMTEVALTQARQVSAFTPKRKLLSQTRETIPLP
jgi:hypothetical protein